MTNSVWGLRLGDAEHQFLEQTAAGTDGILSKAGVARVLIRQAMNSGWTPLDTSATIPAYRVGAGNTDNLRSKAQPHNEATSAVASAPVEKNNPTTEVGFSLGEVVGKGSGETPKKPRFLFKSSIPENLEWCRDDLVSYWQEKGGKKSERAAKLLFSELAKIEERYGRDVIKAQLELAAAKGFDSVTLHNYEQFGIKQPKPAWQQEPEMKHPAHRDFTAERLEAERKQREEEEKHNFLGF